MTCVTYVGADLSCLEQSEEAKPGSRNNLFMNVIMKEKDIFGDQTHQPRMSLSCDIFFVRL